MRGKKSGKTTLEYYMEFLQNPTETDLTNDQLNQIIAMHGFRKLHHCTKKHLVESLSSIAFTDPFRSTLKESISSSAFLSMNQVIEDLCSLQWHECSVQSVESVGLVVKEKDLDLDLDIDLGGVCCNNGGSGVVDADPGALSVSKKRKRRRSLKKLDTLAIAAVAASASASASTTCATLTPPGTGSSCASHGSC